MIPIQEVQTGDTFKLDMDGAAQQWLPYTPVYMMTDATSSADGYFTIIPMDGEYAGLAYVAARRELLMVTPVTAKVTLV